MVDGSSTADSERSTRPLLGVAISLGLLGLITVAEVANRHQTYEDAGIMTAVVLMILISSFLVAKRPDHPVSWVMALTALIGAVAAVADATLPPGITEIAWWQVPLAILSGPAWFGLLFTVLVLIPLLFPTGSPPTPRWRWVAWLAGGAFLSVTLAWAFQERFCTAWSEDDVCLATVANPIGIAGAPDPEQSVVGTIGFALLLLCALVALVSLVVRFRRASRVERSQIKWVLFSVGIFVLGTLVLDGLWIELLGQSEPTGLVALVIDQLMWVLVPVSIALAIFRYRLYDIDRIISRTVSYVLVLGLLGAVALGLVSILALFLPSDDPLVVAVATLVVFALFNPLRRRIQASVDRRFNRSRYVAQHVIDDFASGLRDRVDPEGVVDGWVGVVCQTMQPSSISVWVRKTEGTRRDRLMSPKSPTAQ